MKMWHLWIGKFNCTISHLSEMRFKLCYLEHYLKSCVLYCSSAVECFLQVSPTHATCCAEMHRKYTVKLYFTDMYCRRLRTKMTFRVTTWVENISIPPFRMQIGAVSSILFPNHQEASRHSLAVCPHLDVIPVRCFHRSNFPMKTEYFIHFICKVNWPRLI